MTKEDDYTKIINSTISVGLAEIITQPICLIRTRVINMFDTQNVSEYNLTKQIIKDLYNEEGMIGFFRTSPPGVASQMLATALRYSIYTNNENETTMDKVKISALGGALASTIVNPIDVVRVNLQLGYRELLSKPLSFYYNGYAAALWKSSVGGAIYFPMKDYLYKETNNIVVSSIGSSIVAVTVCQPADWLKTRMMSGKTTNLQPISYLRHSFTGYTLNLLKIVPHFTVTMCLLNWLNLRSVDKSN